MTESDNYNTPSWIMTMFKDWFDPCPFNPNWEIDGLAIPWHTKTYVNPPYSDPLPWVRKAILENQQGKTIALLIKLDCTTTYWRELASAGGHFMHVMERVKFNGKSPPFCNVIVLLEGTQ